MGVWFVPVAGILSGGELFFRSPVLWLVVADLFFLSLFWQGDNSGNDSLGVPGDGSRGASNAWSPQPGGEMDLDRRGGDERKLETGDEKDALVS